ncbi:MAG: zinc ribbon domain-containing protein [Candidatus Doudnabacteria bacterium]
MKNLKDNCQSCMMPFGKDPKGAEREHELYCSYCYGNGHLMYEGDNVNEFKKMMVEAIVARGESKWKARLFAFIAGFAPRWKK